MRRDHRTFEVRTPDGPLTVGEWPGAGHVVLAAHGVTGTHAEFHALADELGEGFRILAPDLRGRGASNRIAGPFGMPAHADDLARVLDHAEVAEATLLGHSMGGFVVAAAAHGHPGRVRDLVLVDGGLPPDLGPIADLPIEELLHSVIGPSLDRLRMRFASLEEYYDFWRRHPALRDDWSEYAEAYFAYDLVGEPPELRSGVREDAVLADSESDLRGREVEEALRSLRCPVVFVRAPRGVFNQEPPLFTEEAVEAWRGVIPELRSVLVPDVNHFTILLSARGARAVARIIRGNGGVE